jgi:proline iminopeptidase
MLATEWALRRPAGLVGLLLASPCISIPRWIEDAGRYKAQLPPEVIATIDRHEAAGHTGCPEYQAAMLVYYRRHVCRLDPWPDELERAYAGHGAAVYETMWGPSEFTITGRLREFDRSARLCELGVPTLFTCGRHDEATPETVAWYRDLLPGSELAVFEESAHLAHLEERARYNETVSTFLRRAEEGA